MKLIPIIKLLRPKEWIKNIFVFAPLFFTPSLLFQHFLLVLFGAILFCFTASSIYILNDLVDYNADQLHHIKKNRPLCKKHVSFRLALFLFFFLSAFSLVLCFLLSFSFFIVIGIYYLLNISYCYALKRIPIIDVYCISAGFILRVIAGAKLIHVNPSIWILICTGLLALFLALGKRRDDFICGLDSKHRESMKGYNIAFIDTSIIIIISALFISYAIYTVLDVSISHLGTQYYYLTIPLVLLGILRYLQIILVEKHSGSPTNLLITDKFLLLSVLGWILMNIILLYG